MHPAAVEVSVEVRAAGLRAANPPTFHLTPPTRAAVSSMLELTVKTLPGEHARPLQQDLNRISPDLARAASQAVSQGESLIGQLGSFAQQAGLPEQTASQVRVGRGAGGVGWGGGIGLGGWVACVRCGCLREGWRVLGGPSWEPGRH